MEISQVKPTLSRREQNIAKLPIPGPGRPKGWRQDPIKKARKQLVEEYKNALAEALPLVSPALIKKAVKGDIQAIKEMNDILVEKFVNPEPLPGNTFNFTKIIINNPNGKSIANQPDPETISGMGSAE